MQFSVTRGVTCQVSALIRIPYLSSNVPALFCASGAMNYLSLKEGGESEKLVERIIRMEGWDKKKGNPTKIPLPNQIVQSLSTFQSILFSPVLYPPLWSSDDVHPRARLVLWGIKMTSINKCLAHKYTNLQNVGRIEFSLPRIESTFLSSIISNTPVMLSLTHIC